MKRIFISSLLLLAIMALFAAEGINPTSQNSEGIALLKSSLAPNTLQTPTETSNSLVATNTFPINTKPNPGDLNGQKTSTAENSVQYRGSNYVYYSVPVVLLCVLLIVLIAR